IRREALERIIQRAAELQAGEHDIGEGLTEPELLALGNDVGIPARYLRQAMLEERTRSVAPETRGALAWLAGPATIVAERVVPGERQDVERALTGWMESEESLQVKRRYTDHTTWEPRIGAFASIQRALGAGGKSFALARATEVAGQVTPLEAGFCHVRLTASVRGQRAQRLWGTAALTAFGLALAGVVPILGALAPWSFIPPVVGGGGGAGGARPPPPRGAVCAPAAGAPPRHRHDNERVHVGLEQVLDRLERGEIRPGRQVAGPR